MGKDCISAQPKDIATSQQNLEVDPFRDIEQAEMTVCFGDILSVFHFLYAWKTSTIPTDSFLPSMSVATVRNSVIVHLEHQRILAKLIYE